MGHIAHLRNQFKSIHIWLYHIWSGKNHYLLLENWILYICKTLSPLQPMTFCAKFGWNWHRDSGEKDFQISLKYLRYFLFISPLKRVWPFIWTNLNPLYQRMLCAKFGLNWPSGSGEEYENVKSLLTDGQTDDGRQAIRKSWELKWAKNQTTKQRLGQPKNKQQNIIHDNIYE